MIGLGATVSMAGEGGPGGSLYGEMRIPLLAQNGHADQQVPRQLSGVKRTPRISAAAVLMYQSGPPPREQIAQRDILEFELFLYAPRQFIGSAAACQAFSPPRYQ